MTDIDFEELDKAVNSLMGKREAQQHAASVAPIEQQFGPRQDQDDQQADISENNDDLFPKPVSQPVDTPPEEPSTIAPAPQEPVSSSDSSFVATPSSPAIKRSSGRFMDVVHPSSDMKTNRFDASPTASPRVARTISPIKPFVENQGSAFKQEFSAGLDPQKSVEDVAQVAQPKLESSWDGTEAQSSSALDSPFLSGAIVEKRPLGTSSQYTPESHDETHDDAWGSVESDDQLPAETLAPELGKEIMALESTGVVDTVSEEPETSKLDVTPKRPQAEVANGDIVPQYVSSASTIPEPTPMFQAASEQPTGPSYSEKKKKSWLVVVLIVLFCLIGVGGGAAAYFLLL